MTEKQIEDIVAIFQRVGIWNDGRFFKEVIAYCGENKIAHQTVTPILEIAFSDYLATSIKSENAIRFRLKQLNPTI